MNILYLDTVLFSLLVALAPPCSMVCLHASMLFECVLQWPIYYMFSLVLRVLGPQLQSHYVAKKFGRIEPGYEAICFGFCRYTGNVTKAFRAQVHH